MQILSWRPTEKPVIALHMHKLPTERMRDPMRASGWCCRGPALPAPGKQGIRRHSPAPLGPRNAGVASAPHGCHRRGHSQNTQPSPRRERRSPRDSSTSSRRTSFSVPIPGRQRSRCDTESRRRFLVPSVLNSLHTARSSSAACPILKQGGNLERTSSRSALKPSSSLSDSQLSGQCDTFPCAVCGLAWFCSCAKEGFSDRGSSG
mmetsp:Transcript_20517/g.48854  ORF Transcript_20517/g.48854 Transcript_20517/m.48854 type:complete len:205 (-) Transcript_20517:628-1242(-)